MVLNNSMLTSSLPPLIHLNTTFTPPQKSIICCDENFRTPWSRREERFSCSPSLNTAEGWGPELRGGGSFGLFVPSEIFTIGPELAAVDRTVNVNDGPALVEQRGKYPPAVLRGFYYDYCSESEEILHLGLESVFDWHSGDCWTLDLTGRKMCARSPWQPQAKQSCF